MIALMALAFDNHYRVVVMLAGTKKNLLRQNSDRFRKQLGISSRNDRRIALFTTESSDYSLRRNEVLSVIETGNNVLITVLKHPSHIAQVRDVLSLSELCNQPVLIIDDEGDQASLNTRVRRRSASATYAAIRDLRGVLHKHAFISFTATPQANLLIRTIDELSPEVCVLIEPGRDYTGGSTFHGPEQWKYVRALPEEQLVDETSGTPESLRTALAAFIVGASIRRLRNDEDYHSMLVHVSARKAVHAVLNERIQNTIDLWRGTAKLPDDDPGRASLLAG